MDFADAVESIRPSVVQIVTSEDPRGVLGSGFFVSVTGHVVTACHVVRAHKGHLAIGVPYPNSAGVRENFALAQVERIDEDSDCDVALLRTFANPFAGELPSLFKGPSGVSVGVEVKVAPILRDRPRDGAAAALSGFPLHQPVLITSAGIVASSWKLGHVLILPGQPPTRIPADAYFVDAVANAGNSGGPVFLPDGRVIGVCVGDLRALVGVGLESKPIFIGEQPVTYGAGLTLVSPAGYVAQILSRHGLDVVEQN
jgi:S1-C subfamily serine protease